MLRFWFSQKTCYQFLVKVNHKPHFHCLPRIRADLNKPYILFQFIWQYIVILIWFGLVSDNTKFFFWHFQRITLGLPNKMIGIRQDILECVSMHERIGHGKEKPIPTWKCSDFRLQTSDFRLCNPAISWNKYGQGPMHISNEIEQSFLDFHITYWDITSSPKLLEY